MVLIDSLNLPLTVDQYLKEIEIEYARCLKDVAMIPGVLRLLDHLYNHNIPMAVATSSLKWTFEIKARPNRHLFDKYFRHIVFSSDDDEVKFGKPHPDPYLVCRRRFDPPLPAPEEVRLPS